VLNRLRRSLRRLLLLAALTTGAVCMGYPYLYMFGNSLKTRYEFAYDKVSVWPQRLWHGADQQQPEQPLWQNYVDALTFGRVGIYLRNSLLYALAATAMQLVLDVLAAYAFARMTFPGRSVLFAVVLSTMMLPPAVLLVPQFLIAKTLGLVDTFFGVIAPSAAGAFGIFMLRQFFLNIPGELEDAARIDGCSDFGILWRIVVPLARPALITLGLFIFLGTWNSFVWPLVVVSDWDLYPLTVGLSLFREESTADWPRIFAASVMGSAPLIVLFLFAQKYLIGGIALSGIKG